MKRVCLTRPFGRWLSKTDLSIDALCKAIQEMERGLIDANLGGGLVKKRVALPGRGKSGSTRTLVATNQGSLSLGLKRTIATISVLKSLRH